MSTIAAIGRSADPPVSGRASACAPPPDVVPPLGAALAEALAEALVGALAGALADAATEAPET